MKGFWIGGGSGASISGDYLREFGVVTEPRYSEAFLKKTETEYRAIKEAIDEMTARKNHAKGVGRRSFHVVKLPGRKD